MTEQESKTWVGSSIAEICNHKEVWSFNVTPINVSKYHTVLFKIPVTLKDTPEPYQSSNPKYWDDDHVRMPYSDKSLFPVTENGIDVIKLRWKLIRETLHKPIRNSRELEAAVCVYNSLTEFTVLHKYFDDLQEEETNQFFNGLLPKIISLALNLPSIIRGSLPLLKQNHNRSVSLSQYQVASLLANAFLCTFPWRKETASRYPGVNFVNLFIADKRSARESCIMEKLKCIFNYFRMVTSSKPVGVLTFERKYIHRSSMPRWDTMDNNIGHTKVHIDSSGTIEDNGLGFLQVDFANKNIGGGVLRYGCVQEEIRFVICPELIITRLFIEQLTDSEAVIVTGAQRYSNYSGYGDTFTWESPVNDPTPYDEYGRRRTSICIIDATKYNKLSQQFFPSKMLREVNKAYVGFSAKNTTNLAPVATGNWGCGAFNGSLYLKSLLQLMACSAAKRHLVYYTFGNESFKNDFYNTYIFLATNNVRIDQLWKILCGFSSSQNSEDKLYPYIQQAYFDSKKQPSINNFFAKEEPGPSTRPKNFYGKEKLKRYTNHDINRCLSSENTPKSLLLDEEMPTVENLIKKKKVNNNEIDNVFSEFDVGELIDEMDGKSSKKKQPPEDSFLVDIDKLSKSSVKRNDVSTGSSNEQMEVDGENSQMDYEILTDSKSKKRISDYFQKIT